MKGVFMTEQPEPLHVPPTKNNNTLALISMIAGIISVVALVINFCVPCLGVPVLLFGIAGAIMGFLGKKQIDESNGEQTGRKMAITGIITSLVSIGISVLWWLIGFVLSLLGFGFSGIFERLLDGILSGFF